MKFQRYQVITFLLAAYGLFMTLFFGLDLLKSGQALRFWVTWGAEILVVTLAFFALRKRDRLRKEREKDLQNS